LTQPATGGAHSNGKTRHLPLHTPHFRRAAGRFYLRGNQRLRERSNARGSSRGRLFGGRNGWVRKLFRKIPATYVSPVMYENLSCKQIAEESSRVSRRAAEAAGIQDNQATKDSVVTGVAIVVFWPAAFFVGGDRGNAAELGRLKGEMDALEQASIKKNCGIQFRQG
jgi:hypothetical protein